MKRKYKIFGFVIGALLIFVISIVSGFFLGVLYVTLTHNQNTIEWNNRRDELSVRTESYYPSCEELKNTDLPKLVKKGNDYFFVYTSEDYFYVFGINVEPGYPPQTAWWGAGLEAAISQGCDNN